MWLQSDYTYFLNSGGTAPALLNMAGMASMAGMTGMTGMTGTNIDPNAAAAAAAAAAASFDISAMNNVAGMPGFLQHVTLVQQQQQQQQAAVAQQQATAAALVAQQQSRGKLTVSSSTPALKMESLWDTSAAAAVAVVLSSFSFIRSCHPTSVTLRPDMTNF